MAGNSSRRKRRGRRVYSDELKGEAGDLAPGERLDTPWGAARVAYHRLPIGQAAQSLAETFVPT